MDICDSHSKERNRDRYPKNVLHTTLPNLVRKLRRSQQSRHQRLLKITLHEVSYKTRKEFIKTKSSEAALRNYAANEGRGSNLYTTQGSVLRYCLPPATASSFLRRLNNALRNSV